MSPKIPIDVKNMTIMLDLMPRMLVEEFRAFIFEKNPKGIKVAAVNPKNSALKQYIIKNFGKNVEWHKITEDEIVSVLKNCKKDFKSDILQLAATAQETNNNITRVIDDIVNYAFTEKASDIHIEPKRDEILIRFRLDGVLHTVCALPKHVHSAMIARIKILANLKIDEHQLPQDGRIEPENFPNTSLRVSIMPTLFGEKVALRILNDSNKNFSLKELGFSEKQKNIILDNIEKPFGMIIASGPTGSGKTTTLYSLLQLLKKEGINVTTLEDPVEYLLEGVNQVHINPRVNLTFAAGLRAILRQDPDIIMVGEVRDSETAVMAANAALTGHLVFTTLHTNDAASAFPRLLDMQVEDFVISSTVNIIIAQRLVRKVCDSCAKMEKLDRVILKKIKERKNILEALEEKEEGLSSSLAKMEFRIGKGCDKCFQTGYAGRIGIFEILSPTKTIQSLILNHESAEKIESAAKEEGFKDLIFDGIEKVFAGATTFAEVLRVTRNA